MAIVYLGIGSNVGDRQTNVDRAIQILKERDDVEILAVSTVIETDPVGGPPDQNKFLNGALKIKTDLLPLDLLAALKNIERRLGRKKTDPINFPRTMDLDILFYDDIVVVDGKNIQIPHPRITERHFVLKPLGEIAADFIHPRLKKSIGELLANLENASHPEHQSA